MRSSGIDRRSGRPLLAAGALLAVFAILAPAAIAELSQRGNLFVRFDGGIAPRTLPRHQLAPISVRIEGVVRVPRRAEKPSLRKIAIAVNRAGKLRTAGLPKCREHRLEQATPTDALRRCGTALVGSGGIVARTSLPDQAPTTVRAEILLFNAVDSGHAAILAHVYQAQPTPQTRVIVFKIRRRRGTFGTVITGHLPESLNRNGYLKSIFLQLERRYRFRGKQRSYLGAACSAPSGVRVASFPFAKTSMTFEDGRTLSATMVRSCRVR